MTVDRRPDRQAVLDAHVEVVLAVAGRGVDQAGAGFGGGVRAEHDRRFARDQRVAIFPPVQFASLHRLDHALGMLELVADPGLRQLVGRGLAEEGVEKVFRDDGHAMIR